MDEATDTFGHVINVCPECRRKWAEEEEPDRDVEPMLVNKKAPLLPMTYWNGKRYVPLGDPDWKLKEYVDIAGEEGFIGEITFIVMGTGGGVHKATFLRPDKISELLNEQGSLGAFLRDIVKEPFNDPEPMPQFASWRLNFSERVRFQHDVKAVLDSVAIYGSTDSTLRFIFNGKVIVEMPAQFGPATLNYPIVVDLQDELILEFVPALEQPIHVSFGGFSVVKDSEENSATAEPDAVQ